ncbi:MAG: hypothetical protein F6K55_41315 [Moorea sp. SIO4A3]|nr:hypothetical protein [Moorena sp. SIO4A3]
MNQNINPNSDENQNPDNQGRKGKKVKHILIGSPKQVRHTINAIYALKYAYPDEWTTPEPTENPGEVMTTLIRYLYLD